ncbi:thioesterase domain-containing protein [Actinokineospora sp. G85]|uniref:thioesterase domain-containing protein n=1 Tax=Actinokineospora sp. G85 TaxID=3406626 RepID=UPI003C72352E
MTDSLTSSLLVPIGGGAGPASVLLPPAGGGIGPYLGVAAHLAGRGPVHGVRAAGLAPGERPDTDVAVMVDRFWSALAPLGAPDLLFGWSLGGCLAWELATRYAAGGHRPAVVLVDSPAVPETVAEHDRAGLRERIVGSTPFSGTETDLLERTADAHVTAAMDYRAARTYDGPALYIACTEENPAHVRAWRRLGADLAVREVHCGHFDVLHGPHLAEVLDHIDDFLGALPRGAEQPGSAGEAKEGDR